MIILGHVSKRYDDVTLAVDDLSVQCATGEITVLVGLLRMRQDHVVAHDHRLVEPTAGTISVDGRDVREVYFKEMESGDSVSVTTALAAAHHLESIGNLKAIESQVTIGAAPEFQTRQEGLLGLQKLYGLTLKFKVLDEAGPLTIAAPNAVSAALTTSDLVQFVGGVVNGHADPATVAAQFAQFHLG